MTATETELKPHPCPFPDEVLAEFQTWVGRYSRERGVRSPAVLDPMAGIGRIHDLELCKTWSIELEEEWAAWHERTICGDARLIIPHFAGYPFDIIATSPAYGNRLADQYLPPESDKSRRYTYAVSLGRRCSEASGAALQWGDDYRELHESIWSVCVDHLKPGGFVLLNCKNHYRKGIEQRVAEWHVETLERLGMKAIADYELGTDGIKHSPHRDRFPERIVALAKVAS